MQQLMSKMRLGLTEEFFVQFLNLLVVMGLTQFVAGIFVVECVGTLLHVGIKDIDFFIGQEAFQRKVTTKQTLACIGLMTTKHCCASLFCS